MAQIRAEVRARCAWGALRADVRCNRLPPRCRAPDASGTPRAVAAECSPHEGSGSSPAAAIKASLLGSYDELIHHESDAEAMAGEAGPQSRPAPHRGDGKDDDGPARARSRARARAWNRLYMPRDDVLTRLKAGLLASVASPSAAAESVSGDGSGADSTASYVALSDDDGDGGVSRGVVDAPLAGQGEATVRGPGPSAPLPEVWQAMHEARMRYYLPIHELMGENTAYAVRCDPWPCLRRPTANPPPSLCTLRPTSACTLGRRSPRSTL